MPKLRAGTDVSPIGCLVRGRWARADSTPVANQVLRFEPERGGVWQGQVIGKDQFTVQTDADGRFVIALAPSRVVGLYTVRMGKAMWKIEVPETAEAEFWQIVV